jgi:hypothetical protein
MEEPIITFGSESLILEMTPDTVVEILSDPEDEIPLPEHRVLPLPEPISKGWCILS